MRIQDFNWSFWSSQSPVITSNSNTADVTLLSLDVWTSTSRSRTVFPISREKGPPVSQCSTRSHKRALRSDGADPGTCSGLVILGCGCQWVLGLGFVGPAAAFRAGNVEGAAEGLIFACSPVMRRAPLAVSKICMNCCGWFRILKILPLPACEPWQHFAFAVRTQHRTKLKDALSVRNYCRINHSDDASSGAYVSNRGITSDDDRACLLAGAKKLKFRFNCVVPG